MLKIGWKQWSRRRRVFTCLAACALLIAVGASTPGPLAGCYPIRNMCLCDSESALRFDAGRIIQYSTNHPPAEAVGTYRSDGIWTADAVRSPDDDRFRVDWRCWSFLWGMVVRQGQDDWKMLFRLPGSSEMRAAFREHAIVDHPIRKADAAPDEPTHRSGGSTSVPLAMPAPAAR